MSTTTSILTANYKSFRQQHRRTQDNDENDDDEDDSSLQEIIATNLILRLFEAYLSLGLLIPEIKGEGPYTLFTPWDRPMRRDIDATTAAKLQRSDRAWIVHLQNFMHLHMYNGDLKPLDFSEQEEGTMYTMANGQDVSIKRTPGTIRM